MRRLSRNKTPKGRSLAVAILIPAQDRKLGRVAKGEVEINIRETCKRQNLLPLIQLKLPSLLPRVIVITSV